MHAAGSLVVWLLGDCGNLCGDQRAVGRVTSIYPPAASLRWRRVQKVVQCLSVITTNRQRPSSCPGSLCSPGALSLPFQPTAASSWIPHQFVLVPLICSNSLIKLLSGQVFHRGSLSAGGTLTVIAINPQC